ncbi:MAG TPA: hypothetical protein PKK43_03915 [Spirochaetota bacterium]|nr:hypothetical protein [Spirochaetota bacterium]
MRGTCDGMNVCPECYADNPRSTPLRGAAACLSEHRQYICSTCGRMICADGRGERRARCFMPFGSVEEARLYLRSAEVISEGPCAIWEFVYPNGDHRFRIFAAIDERDAFLSSNRKVRSVSDDPVAKTDEYRSFPGSQLRYVTKVEAGEYLSSMGSSGEGL